MLAWVVIYRRHLRQSVSLRPIPYCLSPIPFHFTLLRTLLLPFAFFCTHKKFNSFPFNRFCTLSQNIGGWGATAPPSGFRSGGGATPHNSLPSSILWVAL